METWLTVKDKAEAIVNEVARNSPKGSYWEQYRETAIFEPVTSDRDVLSLCADALNTAEEHADNLREYVAGLESEVAENQRLSEELSRLKDYGPMDDVKFQRLQKWTEENDGFTPYKLHGSEFILGWLKGCLKERRQSEKVEPEEKIPSQVLELFKIPLSRNRIKVSDSPLVDKKGMSSYRFITLCSVASLMEDWHTNKGNTDIPPTKLICEWVYAEGKDKKVSPLNKGTVNNHR